MPRGLPEVTQYRVGLKWPLPPLGRPAPPRWVSGASLSLHPTEVDRVGLGNPRVPAWAGPQGPLTVLGFNYRPLVLLGEVWWVSAHGQLWGRPGVDLFQGFWAFRPLGWMPWGGGRVGRGWVDF